MPSYQEPPLPLLTAFQPEAATFLFLLSEASLFPHVQEAVEDASSVPWAQPPLVLGGTQSVLGLREQQWLIQSPRS